MYLWFLLCLESHKTVTVIHVCKLSPLPSVCKVPFHCSQVLDCITVQQEVIFSLPPVKFSVSIYWGEKIISWSDTPAVTLFDQFSIKKEKCSTGCGGVVDREGSRVFTSRALVVACSLFTLFLCRIKEPV